MGFFSILTAVTPLLDRVLDLIPDSNARAKARQELTMRLVEIEAQQKLAQVELNKVEAQHKSLFVAGWRPAVGWVGVAGLAWQYILQPFIVTVATIAGYDVILPTIDSQELTSLLFAMLGVGAMRSYDKRKGVATQSIGAPKINLNE